MKTIGQLVEETLDYSDRGLFDAAFLPACEALRQTAEMAYANERSAEPEFQRYIREYWYLISFMGIPRRDSIPPNLPFSLRRAVPSFNIPNIYEEIVIHAVRHTLATHRIPLELGFNSFGATEVEGEKLLLPKSLLFALLGSVVFNPINKNESVAEKYWLNIWDFKMFISELWGRIDLAERVIKLYR
jgi:hypothetical protein